jgi:hypothetical protein
METQTDTTCDMCHGPNPTGNDTCSRTCAEDLALATGRITDYPEETHMDTDLTTVYYEPTHDIKTSRVLTAVLTARGYALDSDASTLRYSPVSGEKILYPFPDQSIEIHDGRLKLCTVDGESDLKPRDQFSSATGYATALADALDANRGI